MVYLFVTSIIPTVPGAWLTFAEGPIYSAYEVRTRLFGISVVSDSEACMAANIWASNAPPS